MLLISIFITLRDISPKISSSPMSATTSGGENASFGSSQSTPSWREQLMCWTARLTGLSTCNFRWHHDFCTRCAAKVYWSQHYKFTDGYSVPVLVQILLTVQNQIDFWAKRETETQMMSMPYTVKPGFYLKYKENELYVLRKSPGTKPGPPHSSFSDLSHSSSDPNPASLGLSCSHDRTLSKYSAWIFF